MENELREIKLGGYGIVLHLDDDHPGGGSIENDDLYDRCDHYGTHDCLYECDDSGAEMRGTLAMYKHKPADEESDVKGRIAFNGGVDAMMSFILAAACAGIDVETPAFLEAIKTTLDAIGNNDG